MGHGFYGKLNCDYVIKKAKVQAVATNQGKAARGAELKAIGTDQIARVFVQ